MNKLKLITFIAAFLGLVYFNPLSAQTATPKADVKIKQMDTDEAAYIAGKLLDSSVLVGIFEAPGVKSPLHTLKNNTMPELEDKYLSIVMNHRLMKMNTIKSFQGTFDSLIFIQVPTINTDAEEPLQFYPYPETRWLLLLTSPYNADGKPNADWAGALENENAGKYLNQNTLYEVTSEYHGNEIVKWNNDYNTAYNAFGISQEFVTEFGKLMQMLKTVKSSSGPPTVMLNTGNWKDKDVMRIANALDQMLHPKPPVEEKENTKGQ